MRLPRPESTTPSRPTTSSSTLSKAALFALMNAFGSACTGETDPKDTPVETTDSLSDDTDVADDTDGAEDTDPTDDTDGAEDTDPTDDTDFIITLGDLGVAFERRIGPPTIQERPVEAPLFPGETPRNNQLIPLAGGGFIAMGSLAPDFCLNDFPPILDANLNPTGGCFEGTPNPEGVSFSTSFDDFLIIDGVRSPTEPAAGTNAQLYYRVGSNFVHQGIVDPRGQSGVMGALFTVNRTDGLAQAGEPGGILMKKFGDRQYVLHDFRIVVEGETARVEIAERSFYDDIATERPYVFKYTPSDTPNSGMITVLKGGQEPQVERIQLDPGLSARDLDLYPPGDVFFHEWSLGGPLRWSRSEPMGEECFHNNVVGEPKEFFKGAESLGTFELREGVVCYASTTSEVLAAVGWPNYPNLPIGLFEPVSAVLGMEGELLNPASTTFDDQKYNRAWGAMTITVLLEHDGEIEMPSIQLLAGGEDAYPRPLVKSDMGLYIWTQALESGAYPGYVATLRHGARFSSYKTTGQISRGTFYQEGEIPDQTPVYGFDWTSSNPFIGVPIKDPRAMVATPDGNLLVSTSGNLPPFEAPAEVVTLIPDPGDTTNCHFFTAQPSGIDQGILHVNFRDTTDQNIVTAPVIPQSHSVQLNVDPRATAAWILNCVPDLILAPDLNDGIVVRQIW